MSRSTFWWGVKVVGRDMERREIGEKEKEGESERAKDAKRRRNEGDEEGAEERVGTQSHKRVDGGRGWPQ